MDFMICDVSVSDSKVVLSGTLTNKSDNVTTMVSMDLSSTVKSIDFITQGKTPIWVFNDLLTLGGWSVTPIRDKLYHYTCTCSPHILFCDVVRVFSEITEL